MSKLIRFDQQFLTEIWTYVDNYVIHFEKGRFRESLRFVMELSSACNKFTQDQQIWDKSINKDKLLNKLAILANMIRLIALLYANKFRAIHSKSLCKNLFPLEFRENRKR